MRLKKAFKWLSRCYLRQTQKFRSKALGLVSAKLKASRRGLTLGRKGERVASRYLQKQGYQLVCRNWRVLQGELDLVCVREDQLLFVEVKSRFRNPQAERHLFDNITQRKRATLERLMQRFCYRNTWTKRYPEKRLDVIGVLFERRGFPQRVEIKQIKGL